MKKYDADTERILIAAAESATKGYNIGQLAADVVAKSRGKFTVATATEAMRERARLINRQHAGRR